jgi:hypothetical protein
MFFYFFSLVTLDSRPMIVEILPNKYIYNITERLTPTDYQSVLPTEFVLYRIS